MNPFVHVSVQPSYGKKTAFITWNLLSGFEGGDVYVYRSPDGVSNWEILNNDAPVQDYDHYEDQVFVVGNRVQLTHYRLLLEHKGKEYLSPVIGLIGNLTRSEYALARHIMQREYDRMRAGNGIPVLMYAPLTRGELPPGLVDADTDQQFHTGTVDPRHDTYGEKYVGGFNAPISTWVELMDTGNLVLDDTKSESGDVDDIRVQATFLAFPRPRRDYLVVDPVTDNRYVVISAKAFSFKGVVAVKHEVALQMLARTDPRYRVPIPS